MNPKVEKILFELEEKCKMEINSPASEDEISETKQKYPVLPKAVLDTYRISNGVEINVPGTVIYSIEKMKSVNANKAVRDYARIGVTAFGDEIIVDRMGKVHQVDHEIGEEFLDWDTFEEFLTDELSALE